jgi:hypothetical protein
MSKRFLVRFSLNTYLYILFEKLFSKSYHNTIALNDYVYQESLFCAWFLIHIFYNMPLVKLIVNILSPLENNSSMFIVLEN